MKPTLYAMIGLPCSGKTTHARALAARTGAVRFTPDEWQTRIVGDDNGAAEHEARHDAVEAIMREMADEFLSHGISIILDFGFWAREERDYLRRHAWDMGADFEMHYMDVPRETLFERMERRNVSGQKDIFVLTRQQMESFYQFWQEPADDEEGLVRIKP
jgi:predicted kinase